MPTGIKRSWVEEQTSGITKATGKQPTSIAPRQSAATKSIDIKIYSWIHTDSRTTMHTHAILSDELKRHPKDNIIVAIELPSMGKMAPLTFKFGSLTDEQIASIAQHTHSPTDTFKLMKYLNESGFRVIPFDIDTSNILDRLMGEIRGGAAGPFANGPLPNVNGVHPFDYMVNETNRGGAITTKVLQGEREKTMTSYLRDILELNKDTKALVILTGTMHAYPFANSLKNENCKTTVITNHPTADRIFIDEFKSCTTEEEHMLMIARAVLLQTAIHFLTQIGQASMSLDSDGLERVSKQIFNIKSVDEARDYFDTTFVPYITRQLKAQMQYLQMRGMQPS